MGVRYNAGEVFEIARQVERNGARFYRRAAQAFEGEVAGLLLNLAEMEEAHERVFERLQESLPERERQEPLYDPYGEYGSYLHAAAGGHIFDLRTDPAEWLGSARSRSEILRKAIDVEKDSIIYYLGIQASVPEELGREHVDDIIRQEMNHLTLLANRLSVVEEG